MVPGGLRFLFIFRRNHKNVSVEFGVNTSLVAGFEPWKQESDSLLLQVIKISSGIERMQIRIGNPAVYDP